MFDINTLSQVAMIASAMERSVVEAQRLLDALMEQYEEEDLLESKEWDMMDHTLLQLCRLKGYGLTTEWQIKK